MRFVTSICLAVLLAAASASAQVSTGTPPYSTIGGGPFDSVNMGNLNVHFSVPVFSKAGRQLPFSYNISYDSSIWTPVTSNGVAQWRPSSTWGWTENSAALIGSVTFAVVQVKTVPGPNNCTLTTTTYGNYAFHDVLGRVHHFGVNTSTQNEDCGGNMTFTNGPAAEATATDGSGYSINAGPQPSVWSVTSSAGGVTTGSSFTDANGNEITTNGNNYYDTLSSTTPVLTTSGSGTSASPVIFTYTAPSGAGAPVTVNYTQYTVATDFGFTSSPAIEEYGPNSIALISSIELPDKKSYTISYEKTPGSCTPLSGTYSANCVTGRIAEITLPTGGSITYSYTGGPNSSGIFSDGSTAGLDRTLNPGGTWTYTRANVSGTPGPGSTWTTTTVDPAGNNTVSDYAEDSTTGMAATYNFYETQRQVYQGSVSSSNLLETLIVCYGGNVADCAGASVGSPIDFVGTYTQLPNGMTRFSGVTYNGFGLVTDDTEYGYGVTLNKPPSGPLIKETKISYASLGNGIVNLPSSVTINDWTSGSSNTISSTTYTYDNGTQTGGNPTATSGTPQHTSITGSRGNLTTLATQANSGTTLYQTFSYYDTGNLNTSTGLSTSSTSPGPTTTYNYGSGSCGNSFVTSISEPLSLSRSMTWNCTGGVETGVTDENGQTVTATYTDPDFWRPANSTDQENNETAYTYSGQTVTEPNLTFNSGQSVSDQRTTVDGFGRLIFNQRLQGPAATNYDTIETDYNDTGQVSRVTMPYSAAGSPSSQNTSAPGTATAYDALGRPITVATADGGRTAITYTNNDARVVIDGSQFFRRQYEYDGLGRLISVCEISDSTPPLPGVGACGQGVAQTGYLTKYTYDALGHLLAVTQNAQATSGTQSRSYVYDMLGRMTSESNPETGTFHYFWDTYPSGCNSSHNFPGNLAATEDNSGVFTCYGYDALNRPFGANTTVSNNCRGYIYDSATPPAGVTIQNGKGRLIAAYTNSACNGRNSLVVDEWFSYSARGELTDVYQSSPHSGRYYHISQSYLPTGAVASLSSSIAGMPTLNYAAGLDGEGRSTQISASVGQSPAATMSYSSSSTSSVLGALSNITFGSGDGENFSYNPSTGRMAGFQSVVNGVADTGTLTWNTNGTLGQLAISDSISGRSDSETCNYGYDDLARHSSVNCGSAWGQTFSYDAFGNIAKSVPSGSTGTAFSATYSSATNQIASLPGGTVRYDANGKLLMDNFNSYTWDAWGDLATVSNGSAPIYDALGRMVENNYGGSGSFTEYVYGPGGERLALTSGSSLLVAFMPLAGGTQAVYNSSGLLHYTHADWEGTERLASTPTRTVSSTSEYAPFGEMYGTTGDDSYTGQLQTTVGSLLDFPFRRYSPSQGRWISPDPAGVAAVDPTNPQSWNRYSYALNNPLSFIDPLGLIACYTGALQLIGNGQAAIDNGDYYDQDNWEDVSAEQCGWDGGYVVVAAQTTVVNGGGGDDGAVPPTYIAYLNIGFIPNVQGYIHTQNARGSGRSGYESLFCLGDALKSNGLSLALDAVGLIPAGGSASAAFSLFHGAAGISNGTNILSRVQVGAGLIGTASAGNAVQNGGDNLDQAALATGGLSIAAALGKAAPVYGQVLSGISLGIDLVKTYQAQSACVNSGKYD